MTGEMGMDLRRIIVSQFANPRGLLGTVAGWIMAHRPSNKARNLPCQQTRKSGQMVPYDRKVF